MGIRWLYATVIALVVGIVVPAGDASAQAFKPRPGAKTPAKTPAKKAPAKRSSSAKRPKASKKTSRAAQTSGRPEDLTPDEAPAKRSAPEDDDDYVLIEDDEE